MIRHVIVFTQERSLPPNLGGALTACGIEMQPVRSEAQLLESVDRLSPECAVVLSCTVMDAAAINMTEQVRRIDHTCPLLVLMPGMSTETVICAMRSGASDVIEENAEQEKIEVRLRAMTGLHAALPQPHTNSGDSLCRSTLAGGSATMWQLRSQIVKIAAVDASVLITGETGTGKELVAQLIHKNSRRSNKPFVAVNCAAMPDALLESELFGYERGAFTGAMVARDGKVQHASGGVLFLDEVGDMSLAAQAKILRVIESRMVQRLGSNTETQVQVRLITATNQNLETMTKEKRFREDLYFRLNVVRLELPPLRERAEDIPELVEHIVNQLNQRNGGPARRIGDDVIRRFQSYQWPGNVREMRNVLESVLVLSSPRLVGVADLPSNILQRLRSSETRFGGERSKIISALKSADWNRNEAARVLSCSRMTLYRKMVKYAIDEAGARNIA